MKWYEADVQQVEKQIKELEHSPATIFYGSSSIRLWNTLYDDFKPYCPANMGFGGSTLEACVYFFPRMMKHMQPKYLVVYAGDNDLGDGKSPEMVLKYFIQLNGQIRNQFGDIPYTYLSVKPSITRWHINATIKHTNLLIKNVISSWKTNTFFVDIYNPMLDQTGFPKKRFYEADGLHLSADGYQLWKEILLIHMSSQFNNLVTGY
ncbi:hypothetical protein BH10BAC3_BH10BAC3_35400 [soil metagenome]